MQFIMNDQSDNIMAFQLITVRIKNKTSVDLQRCVGKYQSSISDIVDLICDVSMPERRALVQQ